MRPAVSPCHLRLTVLNAFDMKIHFCYHALTFRLPSNLVPGFQFQAFHWERHFDAKLSVSPPTAVQPDERINPQIPAYY